MYTIIEVENNEILIKNNNDVKIIDYSTEIFGIIFNNYFIDIKISYDILDSYIENNNKTILITNTNYIIDHIKYFKNYINDLEIILNKQAIVVMDIEKINDRFETILYIGNKNKIYTSFENNNENIEIIYSNLEDKIVQTFNIFNNMINKYTTLLENSVNIIIINRYTKIINIINKGYNKLNYSNIFVNIQPEIDIKLKEIKLIEKELKKEDENNSNYIEYIKELIINIEYNLLQTKSDILIDIYNKKLIYLKQLNLNNLNILESIDYIDNIDKHIDEITITSNMLNNVIQYKRNLEHDIENIVLNEKLEIEYNNLINMDNIDTKSDYFNYEINIIKYKENLNLYLKKKEKENEDKRLLELKLADYNYKQELGNIYIETLDGLRNIESNDIKKLYMQKINYIKNIINNKNNTNEFQPLANNRDKINIKIKFYDIELDKIKNEVRKSIDKYHEIYRNNMTKNNRYTNNEKCKDISYKILDTNNIDKIIEYDSIYNNICAIIDKNNTMVEIKKKNEQAMEYRKCCERYKLKKEIEKNKLIAIKIHEEKYKKKMENILNKLKDEKRERDKYFTNYREKLEKNEKEIEDMKKQIIIDHNNNIKNRLENINNLNNIKIKDKNKRLDEEYKDYESKYTKIICESYDNYMKNISQDKYTGYLDKINNDKKTELTQILEKDDKINNDKKIENEYKEHVKKYNTELTQILENNIKSLKEKDDKLIIKNKEIVINNRKKYNKLVELYYNKLENDNKKEDIIKCETNINTIKRIEKYINIFINKYKDIYIKLLNIENIFNTCDKDLNKIYIKYQKINYDIIRILNNINTIDNIISNIISNIFDIRLYKNELKEINDKYNNFLNASSINNYNNYNCLIKFYKSTVKEKKYNADRLIINIVFINKIKESLFNINKKKYNVYKISVEIIITETLDIYQEYIDKNINVTRIDKNINELCNNYKITLNKYRDRKEEKDILLNINNNIKDDNEYINDIIEVCNHDMDIFNKKIFKLRERKRLYIEEKKEQYFEDILNKIKENKQKIETINVDEKIGNIITIIEEYSKKIKIRINNEKKRIEKKKEDRVKRLTNRYEKYNNMINKNKNEKEEYVNYLKENIEKDKHNEIKNRVYKISTKKRKYYIKKDSFQRVKTLTIW